MSDGTWQDTATAPKDRRISLKTASGVKFPTQIGEWLSLDLPLLKN
jgi:hypothetical protein